MTNLNEQAIPVAELSPLERGRQTMMAKRASGELVIERLDPIERAKRNPHSLRKAITAACWQCMGCGADPNTRQNIRDCGVPTCALHPHRPWQKVLGRNMDQLTEEEVELAAAAGQDLDDAGDDEDE